MSQIKVALVTGGSRGIGKASLDRATKIWPAACRHCGRYQPAADRCLASGTPIAQTRCSHFAALQFRSI